MEDTGCNTVGMEVIEVPAYKPDALDRFSNGVVAWFKQRIHNVNYSLSMRQLEKSIARALELADGHKSAGVPQGDQRFKTIDHQVKLEIQAFLNAHPGVTHDDIVSQIPGLKLLDDLAADPTPPEPMTPGKAIGFGVLGMFAPFAVGVFIAIGVLGYSWVLHLLGPK